MLVKDFMQTDVLSIEPQASLLEAAQKILSGEVDTLLVIEDEKLLGMIGLRDLFTAPIPAHYGNPMVKHDNEEQFLSIWKETSVQNLMNQKVISVDENTTLSRAAELMANTGKHPLPVLRDGRVLGVISRADIVRVLLAG